MFPAFWLLNIPSSDSYIFVSHEQQSAKFLNVSDTRPVLFQCGSRRFVARFSVVVQFQRRGLVVAVHFPLIDAVTFVMVLAERASWTNIRLSNGALWDWTYGWRADSEVDVPEFGKSVPLSVPARYELTSYSWSKS